MTTPVRARRSRCNFVGYQVCQAFYPGHNVHWIHARHIGESPWGWRDGVVTSTTEDGFITVEYTLEQGAVEAWHHGEIIGRLTRGTPVRIHEGYYVLALGGRYLNLLISSGLGAVPKPQEPELWEAEVTGGVVDLSTGEGVDLNHPDDGSK